jgi:DNA mismatch endonuclease (patch repair protein)
VSALPAIDPPDAARSRTMRAVRGRDTGPERRVRRLLFGLGYRYRLHRAGLPGTPDLVFPARRAVVFVHGCFWHGHDCRRGARAPKRNAAYWAAKVCRNRERDAAVTAALAAAGWRSHVVWECALNDPVTLSEALVAFLGPPGAGKPG